MRIGVLVAVCVALAFQEVAVFNTEYKERRKNNDNELVGEAPHCQLHGRDLGPFKRGIRQGWNYRYGQLLGPTSRALGNRASRQMADMMVVVVQAAPLSHPNFSMLLFFPAR
jgi:hypothetical protein